MDDTEAIRLYEAGLVAGREGRPEEAVDLYERSLKLAPRSANTLRELGVACQDLLRYEDAIRHYRTGLEIAPNDGDLHVFLALASLTLGDYETGFREFEWRWHSTRLNTQRLEFDAATWDGSNIGGRRLLVYAEQGLGDVIQFARYATLLAERGVTVIFGVQPPIETLLATVPGMHCSPSRFDQTPSFDLQVPSFSLPYLFGTRLDTITRELPYIFANPERVEAWRQALAGIKEFRVGLVWSGSPKNANDRNRSIPLEMFAPLAEVPGVKFISLQKGERENDEPPPDLPFATTEVQRLPRLRGADGEPRPGDLRRHGNGSPGGSARQAGVGADPVRAGLALDAGARGQPLVSVAAAVSTDGARRLGRRHPTGRRGIEGRGQVSANTRP